MSFERAEAKAAGLVVYDAGKPCPQGHAGPRYVSSGVCRDCTKQRARRSRDKRRKAALRVAERAAKSPATKRTDKALRKHREAVRIAYRARLRR
jgi:hypothetical protein